MSFLKRIIKKRDGSAEDGSGAKAGPLPVGSNGGGGASSSVPSSAPVQAMSADLQRKFARGVQFNVKIVIRGDKNVGKTALFYRLQGLPFKEEYIPTDEIQVASIHWNYKNTDDIVKVEVWDVVDKGRKKKNVESLKLDHDASANDSEPCLDASFVDVYKGTHAVIFVFDMTKQWTYKYIERELPLVPAHIPVIVLANHRDMGEHRTVDPDTVGYFLASLERGADAGRACYAEASMLNGFGLKYLHKFFNIPYLKLQRDTIAKQLELNSLETQAMHEELLALEESEEQNYQMFVSLREQRRKEAVEVAEQRKDASAPAPAAAARPVLPQQQQQERSPASARAASVAPRSGGERPPTAADSPRHEPAAAAAAAAVAASTTPAATGASSAGAAVAPAKSAGFMSRFFSKKSAQETPTTNQVADSASLPTNAGAGARVAPASKVLHVDDFVPTEDADSALDFLEDAAPSSAKKQSAAQASSKRKASAAAAAAAEPSRNQHQQQQAVRQPANASDSDDDESAARSNPMVAGFQDDLDSSDNEATAPASLSSRPLASAAVDLSTDDDGDDSGPQLPPSRQQQQQLPSTAAASFRSPAAAVPASGRLTLSMASLSSSSEEEEEEADEEPSRPTVQARMAEHGWPSSRAATGSGSAAAAARSKSRPVASSGDDDDEEDDLAEARGGIVVLADEDAGDDFPAAAAPKAAALRAKEQAITMTAADLDFLDSITSSPKVPGADSNGDTHKEKAKKKKKAASREASEKDGGSKRGHSKKHKSRGSADGSGAAHSVDPPPPLSGRSVSSAAAAASSAKESKKHTQKKAGGGGAAATAAAERSEVDALEAFLTG